MSDFSEFNNGKMGSGDKSDVNLSEEDKKFGRDLRDTASELGDRVAGAMKDQASDLGAAAKDFAAGATDKINAAVDNQKTAGAEYVGNVAQAIHRAANEFEKEIPQAAQYIHSAAERIDTVAKAVSERDVGQLYNEVRHFARRQPTAFFGGAVILGFAALRFFKSSQAAGQGQTQASSRGSGNRTENAGSEGGIPRRSADMM